MLKIKLVAQFKKNFTKPKGFITIEINRYSFLIYFVLVLIIWSKSLASLEFIFFL